MFSFSTALTEGAEQEGFIPDPDAVNRLRRRVDGYRIHHEEVKPRFEQSINGVNAVSSTQTSFLRHRISDVKSIKGKQKKKDNKEMVKGKGKQNTVDGFVDLDQCAAALDLEKGRQCNLLNSNVLCDLISDLSSEDFDFNFLDLSSSSFRGFGVGGSGSRNCGDNSRHTIGSSNNVEPTRATKDGTSSQLEWRNMTSTYSPSRARSKP